MIPTQPKITLAAARVNADFTVVEAAERIGVSPTTLTKWERDASSVKSYQMKKIEEVYQYPTSYIKW